MLIRITLGTLLASWIVFGVATNAGGQVILDTALEDARAADNRYGDYEPASPEFEGPVLLSQTIDTVPNPAPVVGQPIPLLPGQLTVPASPPVVRGPPIMDYGSPSSVVPPPRRNCPPWRPCGPQESFGMNWFIPQGFAGADFRPACANHDACLMSGCAPRKLCDQLFPSDLDCACNNSMFPFLCRLEARKCYLGVRLFGWMF